MVGRTFSHYEILEILGEYRLGPVFRARDLVTDRPVAVQIIEHATARPDIPDPRTSIAFRTPVVTVFDVGPHERGIWIASELPEGESLHNCLQRLKAAGQSFPREALIECVLEIGEGISHLHKHGILHGNLTSRCIIRDQGCCKVTAFDVSGLICAGPVTDAGVRRDIVCFGELICELATGEPSSESLQPTPPGLAAELVTILRRALAATSEESYKSIDDLLLDVRRLAASQLTTKITAFRVRPDPHNQWQFREGQLVAERFRIIRFVARGGMGEVYEAEDLELRERVALKTIRSEIAADPPAVERFRREIQLARRITHPNVCRLFDIFRHPVSSSSTSDLPVLFLTMELLNGQTLAHRIHGLGPMNEEEALPVIAQMASGLEAAHRAGIIHRDFKSANVILVGGDSNGPTRAVITDFGLAGRFARADDVTLTVAGTGVFGTPAYMSPEQVLGADLTPASDIYAFGVVIYEMITGALPFADTSALAAAAKRLHESPVNPRVHRPELSGPWEAAILKCLERAPDRRFQRAAEVVDALTDGAAQIEPFPPKVPPPSPQPYRLLGRRFLPMLLIAVILAVLAGVYSLRVVDRGQYRRSVAVLGFRNLSGAPEAAWLSNAFSEMLTTELGAGEKLRTVSGEIVARMKIDLNLKEVETSLARDTLARIRNYLGSDVIAFGSYVVVAGSGSQRIRLDLRLQDVRSGEMLAAIVEEVPLTELLSLVARAGSRLRSELGVGPLSSTELAGLRATLPSNEQSLRLYTEGLDRLRRFDALEARQFLERAVQNDPDFALARSALATAWAMSGYAGRAKAEAQAALKLSGGLPREDSLLVGARYHEAAGEWEQAAEKYRTLFGFFPDNLEYGLRLAGTRVSAGRADEALSTLNALRKLPPPDRDNPRIDLTESRAAGARADYEGQRKAAAAAVAKAEAQGAKLMAAGGRLHEGIALQHMGKLREAVSAFERARADYLEAGDHWSAVNALHNRAVAQAKNGDLEEARRGHEEALALYRRLGDRAGEAAALTSLASLMRMQGRLSEARMLLTEAIGIYRETGNRPQEAIALNNLANVLASAGELSEATKTYELALPVFKETGDDNAVATILTNLAGLRFDEGALADAADLYEQARVLFDRVGAQISVAFVLSRLGDLQLARGSVTTGRQHHEQALAIRLQLGERGGVADSHLALAQIALHENRPVDAEALARDALREFREQSRVDDKAMAHSVLAAALLAQSRVAEAWESVRVARTESEASSNHATRLAIQTTAASVQAMLGDTQSATDTLTGVIEEARRNGLRGLEFEARLALGQVEIRGGNPSAGRARLAALQKEAAVRGYARIAQRAAQQQK